MALNIPLTDNWRILTDKNNWILAKEENGRITHDSFYQSLEHLIKSFAQRKIRGFNSTSLLALNNSIKRLEEGFYKAVQHLESEEASK